MRSNKNKTLRYHAPSGHVNTCPSGMCIDAPFGGIYTPPGDLKVSPEGLRIKKKKNFSYMQLGCTYAASEAEMCARDDALHNAI